jgi:hypothetical protein
MRKLLATLALACTLAACAATHPSRLGAPQRSADEQAAREAVERMQDEFNAMTGNAH